MTVIADEEKRERVEEEQVKTQSEGSWSRGKLISEQQNSKIM
jgi:hypothetical protein